MTIISIRSIIAIVNIEKEGMINMSTEQKLISKKTLDENVKDFTSDSKTKTFTKTKMTTNWMDSYVFFYAQERWEEWSKALEKIPYKEQTFGTSDKKHKATDIKAIRDKFLEMFLPDYTDEAIEKREKEAKEERRREREAKRELEEAEKNKTHAQRMADKFARFKKEAEQSEE